MIRIAENLPLMDRMPRGEARRLVGILVLSLGLVLTWIVPVPAEARIVKTQDQEETPGPQAVFEMIAQAWEEGDQQTLADLVHEAGLKVTTGGQNGRSTQYSPSQAFYYFKNVFQTHRTLIFTFEKMQDATAGERVHGMAVWKRRRPDSERVQELKLVCVLARQDDRWMLAEINKIR